MKNVIFIDIKGSFLEFYFGENGKQLGDDWDDVPFEHNAGDVYGEYIKEKMVICLKPDYQLVCPSEYYHNSPFSMEDFIKRKIPRYLICKRNSFYKTFEDALEDKNNIQLFFGDSKEEIARKIPVYIPEHIIQNMFSVPLEEILKKYPDYSLNEK